MKKIKVAIIGQGRSGRDIHGKYFKSAANVNFEVAYVVEADEFRRNAALSEYPGCKVFSDYKELFDVKDIDLVVNASFSEMHYAITKDLLLHTFNVLCEKPMARTYFECTDLIKTAKDMGVTLAVFQQSFFAPHYMHAKKIVESGKLGDIMQVSIRYNNFARRWDWQTLHKKVAGGLYNTGPHPVGLALGFLDFDENTTIPTGAQFVVRRGSDGDNFTIWDEVYNYTLPAAITGQDSISFDDYTVESGVLYKYEINYVDHTTSTPVYYSIVEGPAMTIFDHAFLTGEGTQLCVKFNPNIGGFQINVGDGKVTPVGSQYPYINRNGDMYYRSFSLSGTIAYEMDEQHMFASRSSIYGDWIQVYGSYFVNHYMNQQNDRVTQRKFREIVTRYLYDDVPKLFRSTPEGNILVRLTDITLTPNTQLGRMIYDFSCTATEIGEPSIENCKLYKVQDFGD